MQAEVNDCLDILLGREPPPINNGVMTLMEVCNGYLARFSELFIKIQRGENEGIIGKGSPYYKFRTGELRQMVDMLSKTQELGSRRLTAVQLEYEHRDA